MDFIVFISRTMTSLNTINVRVLIEVVIAIYLTWKSQSLATSEDNVGALNGANPPHRCGLLESLLRVVFSYPRFDLED